MRVAYYVRSLLDMPESRIRQQHLIQLIDNVRIHICRLVCLIREGFVKVSYIHKYALNTFRGSKFYTCDKTRIGDHTGDAVSSSIPLYRLLCDLPLGKNSIHDVRLRFTSPGIYGRISSSICDNTLGYKYDILARSKDISLSVLIIRDLAIRVTIHMTNTVSVTIGCSLNPVPLDINGLIRLSNALSVVEERLSRIVEDSIGSSDLCEIAAEVSSGNRHRPTIMVPAHSGWIVTMWHFGADASVEYSGERFSVTWEVAENVLVRAYSKVMKDNRMRIRLERQEYPKVTLADIIEQKLSGGDQQF
jgi:hypothetical protein